MIFTSPITHPPEAQRASGSIPVRTIDDGTFTNYEILAGQTEEMDAFNKPDQNPESDHAYILKFRTRAPVRGTSLALLAQFEGDNTQTDNFLGWNAQRLTPERIITAPHPYDGVNFEADPEQVSHLYLIPRDFALSRIRVKVRNGVGIRLDWILFERLVGYIYPTLAFKGRLARMRTSRKSITGQEFNTAASPAQIFSAPLVLKNDPRDAVGELLNYLDQLDAFGVIPNGLDEGMLASRIPYREDGFTRNMLVARNFRGFAGYQGIDRHGFSGRMELRETYYSD